MTDWGTRLQELDPSRATEEDEQHPRCSGGCLMFSAPFYCLEMEMEMEAGRVSCWLEKDKCCLHLQNGQEVYLGKHRWTPFGPCMEQVFLEGISGPVKWKAFGCLINLVAFYDKINGFLGDRKVIYLNFNKAFDEGPWGYFCKFCWSECTDN